MYPSVRPFLKMIKSDRQFYMEYDRMSFGDNIHYAVIAQLVVRHIGNVEVGSSILPNSML